MARIIRIFVGVKKFTTPPNRPTTTFFGRTVEITNEFPWDS